MRRSRLRELILLLAIGSAVTIVVFFLALWLLPFETWAALIVNQAAESRDMVA